MKNDYAGAGRKISIPPTVLFSILGFIGDITRAVSSDFKQAGEIIYLLGPTGNELGGSELADELRRPGAAVPVVDAARARTRYRALHQAMRRGLVSACHDLSDGGLAVALAEMAIGGRLGAEINLGCVPGNAGLTPTECLYSESAGRLLASVPPDRALAFESVIGAHSEPSLCARIGEVTGQTLIFRHAGRILFSDGVEALAQAFRATLAW
jgi:phosphoribosylformylglycinamidine synthase